ncbi:MAG: hypothetical protein JSS27_09485 [Planctomycetes bacterium]|nr:hypothetical protein [Planctomycetota bacterium]
MIVPYWKTIVGLLVVFTAGLLIGSALTVGAIQRTARERMNPDNWTPRTLDWLRSEAKLRPDQESAVRPLVERSMQEMRELRDESSQRWRAVVGKLLTEVMPQLDESQQEQLREAVKRSQGEKHRWPYGAPAVGS